MNPSAPIIAPLLQNTHEQAAPTAPNPNDLPPPYSAVVGNPQYGFVPPQGGGGLHPQTVTTTYPVPKQFTPTGVYPHPPTTNQPYATGFSPAIEITTSTSIPPPPPGVQMPMGVMLAPAVGSEPTTLTCFNCHKTVTTKVRYSTAWHTHLVAGSVCVITLVCSLCCLGLIPYCFDTFKDAEHYCPSCNSFLGKYNRC